MSDVSWTTRIREPEDSIMWAEDIMKGISEMDFLTVGALRCRRCGVA